MAEVVNYEYEQFYLSGGETKSYMTHRTYTKRYGKRGRKRMEATDEQRAQILEMYGEGKSVCCIGRTINTLPRTAIKRVIDSRYIGNGDV